MASAIEYDNFGNISAGISGCELASWDYSILSLEVNLLLYIEAFGALEHLNHFTFFFFLINIKKRI